ncbi:hypothetical protein CDAR_518781 [Caerostris darwini]|uniref:Uncharacterized protein n=1 Tax=Caerostris darwini TaxID=1538125 RepID=A0AAV4PSU1_9ARAC|nr:hypothetical protein CDAR_518781 [Caerostris darwini]
MVHHTHNNYLANKQFPRTCCFDVHQLWELNNKLREGSVILTGIIKPHDEGEIAASAPSSSTASLDTLKAIGVSNESVSGTNITRKAVSEINLKISTSQGSNLQGTSQVKSSSTTTLGKNKTKEMAPPAVKDSADKDCRKNFL